MGWYANTNWTLTFKDKQAMKDCAAELAALPDYWGPYNELPQNSSKIIIQALVWFGEDGEGGHRKMPDKSHVIDVWTSGKHHSFGEPAYIERTIGPDGNWVDYNRGGMGIYEILAKHCTGYVNWTGEDDEYWRVRFFGDGRHETYGAEIVVPTDPVNQEWS